MARKKIAIVYHHDDPDGHVAGAILCDYLTDKGIPTAHIPKNYNQRFNEWRDKDIIGRLVAEAPLSLDSDEGESDVIDVAIYLTDLSFTKDSLYLLNEFITPYIDNKTDTLIRIDSIVWIDHHASSKDVFSEVQDLVNTICTTNKEDTFCYFNNDLCGAALTWVYVEFMKMGKTPGIIKRETPASPNIEVEVINKANALCYESMKMPQALVHLDAYDRWTKADPLADAYISGLKYYGYQFTDDNHHYYKVVSEGTIRVLTDQVTDACIRTGQTLFNYQEKVYEEQRDRIYVTTIGGYRVAIKNGLGNSWNFCDLLKIPVEDGGCDYGLLGAYDPTIDKYRYSLYRNETVGDRGDDWANCRKMAESLGGGGHLGAAGFAVSDSLFDLNDGELVLYFYKYCSDQGAAFGIAPDQIVDYTEEEESQIEIEDKVFVGGSCSNSYGAYNVTKCLKRFFPEHMICYTNPFDSLRENKKGSCRYHVYVFYPKMYSMEEIVNLINDLHDPRYKTVAFFIESYEPIRDNRVKWDDDDREYIQKLAKKYPDTVLFCDETTMYFTLGGKMIQIYNKSEGNK